MKRFIIIILVALSWLPMAAQLNGTGYYRIRNVANDTHYITIANDLFNYTTCISLACGGLSQAYSSAGQARAMACAGVYLSTDIHLVEDASCVNPATIIYLKKNSGSQYDIIAQSTSLIELTTGLYPGTLKLQFKNVFATLTRKVNAGANSQYTASVQLKAYNNALANLGTRYFMDNNGTFSISENDDATNVKWYIEPVTSFNVDPSSLVEYKGKYYCTMYTAFAYKLSGQTQKAWAITGIDANGTLTKEVVANNGETVPAGTPVILECSSNEAGACTLVPQGEPKVISHDQTSHDPLESLTSDYTGTNLLKGALFCNTDGNRTYQRPSSTGTINCNYYTSYNASQMLVLGVSESPTGVCRLGFFPYTGDKMKSNKVWLDISGSSANANFTFDTDETNQKGVAYE